MITITLMSVRLNPTRSHHLLDPAPLVFLSRSLDDFISPSASCVLYLYPLHHQFTHCGMYSAWCFPQHKRH